MILLEKFYLWVIKAGMPVVYGYVFLCGNVFFNTAAEDATGLEKIGNQLLSPVQYILAGKVARSEDYELKQRFNYKQDFFWKTVGSTITLPASVVLGTVVKGAAYLFPETREHHRNIVAKIQSRDVSSNIEHYKNLKIPIEDFQTESFRSLQYERRLGDEHNLRIEKEALKEVVRIFKENNIPCWMDCGTLLGTYRYGGAIPWDNDIDIAILAPDFNNAKHALNALNPEKYLVVDWSGRTREETFLVVCIKETGSRIDIAHFAINSESQEITHVLSNEENMFLPEIWKKIERIFVIPTPFDVVFPLTKASFDGIEVFVPNKVEEYLKARYGEDLRPAKVFNPLTGQYEKDLSHPYWNNF
ncbi:MAG: LicD family protein [Chlamydiota bacterium]